jgi:UDP-N-acetylmuramoyl-tripeptide--D-alanyl-D-alanine ligase
MIALSLEEIASVVGGTVEPERSADVVVSAPAAVDSRRVHAGGLFVAVAGEHVDGHDYVGSALAGGAVATLASRAVPGPHVLVEDVVAALGRLARAVLDRLVAARDLQVVALTGSSGKTSTKDLLAQVLSGAGPTVAPEGSFNNELGVPLTVLAADERTRHLVVEMGARGGGHISDLTRIAPPRIGLVLNVGSAHAGEFGSRQDTARAKAELVQALPAADAGGVAVLNADDPLVAAMAQVTGARVVTFGTAGDVRALGADLDDRGRARFTLVTPEGDAPVRLRVHGRHHLANALAAAAVARELGMALADVAAGLSAAERVSHGRMEVVERADGSIVVDDAYNANPESMRAALEALQALARGRRSWAVLGEMRELGAASADEHVAVGRLARRLGVDRLVVVGEAARGIHTGAVAEGAVDGEESVLVPAAEDALVLLRAALGPGDVVLVKASRAAALERVATGLLEQVAT